MSRLAAALGWNRSSYFLMSGFSLTLLLLGYVWWPLAEEYLSYIDWQGDWWRTFDWLLIGIFLFMSLMIMARASLRADLKIIFVGLLGGLVIESWGTQTEMWFYYTDERPPLWIIPAWPIASLAIDRTVRLCDRLLPGARPPACLNHSRKDLFPVFYWMVFPAFLVLMFTFVAPTLHESLTLAALLLVVLFILTPTDHRLAVLTFAAGAGLGYFLELWGTTRLCWTYYTLEQPPVFAVLAHGMAAVAFWRGYLLLDQAFAALSRLSGRQTREAR